MASKLPTRKVGGTEVSAIGYGAMGISSFYGAAPPDEERFKVNSALLVARQIKDHAKPPERTPPSVARCRV
jgi:hypothetical protein